MKLALEAKNKFGFIDGKCERSTEDHVLVSQWDRCNFEVLTWLLNFVSEELFLGQVFSKYASEVWEDLKETYDKIDGSVVYDLYKKINCISQNGSIVADYYNRLTTMWKQFDAMLKLPTCSCKAAKDYNDFSMLIKLMQFLMGLDDVYQPVRTNLLTREEFPSVKVAFSVVSREESHRLSSSGSKGFKKRTNTISGKNTLTSKSNAAVGSSASVSTSGLPFTSEQIAKLLSLVGEKSGVESSNVGGESFTTNSFVSCSSSIFFGGIFSWIVDSGASQHMVNSDKEMFNTIDVSEFDLKVGHPNGTNVKVLKIGNIKLMDNIILKDVFYVLGYNVNLLSIHSLHKDNNIDVVFNENSCILQDSKSRKILVTGSQDSGLYFVGNNGNSVNVCFNSFVKSSLWHSRLGHPSDQVLAVLKENFDVKSIEHGPCDVCHRAKQVRVPFPLNKHKTKSIDDFSRTIWCYLLSNKTEVFENLYNFYELILTQFEKKIKLIRSDNGTEFVNNQMGLFCKNKVPTVPNDEEGTTGAQDHYSDDQQPLSPSTSTTVPNVENVQPESGQSGSSYPGNSCGAEDIVGSHDETNPSEGQSVRRSSRNVSFPKRINEFVVEGKVKYGIEKVVSYANLSVANFCLIASLNKSVEPSTYNEAIKDTKWIEAMNSEMEALYRNNT
ncbi:uncharacterized protein LOC110942612 [Helianthus annuus]|uniref:uncharacterized protein LOC110942612 n=1 Tax=Helianthus annuus TaxID=4232 RepID=UPI000B8F3D9F|nr:uncharacterized protein LOC110942612 [Helianthus annuus]